MPYITALQQKVTHYSNCITFVMRYFQQCILQHKNVCQKRKLQGAVRSLFVLVQVCLKNAKWLAFFWIKLCVLL